MTEYTTRRERELEETISNAGKALIKVTGELAAYEQALRDTRRMLDGCFLFIEKQGLLPNREEVLAALETSGKLLENNDD